MVSLEGGESDLRFGARRSWQTREVQDVNSNLDVQNVPEMPEPQAPGAFGRSFQARKLYVLQYQKHQSAVTLDL
jgi:hypothetical protein